LENCELFRKHEQRCALLGEFARNSGVLTNGIKGSFGVRLK
jgi:hypothetical protein